MGQTIYARFQLRIDTAENWIANNPILLKGEPGIEEDTGSEKLGDGTTAWVDLSYRNAGGVIPAYVRSLTGEIVAPTVIEGGIVTWAVTELSSDNPTIPNSIRATSGELVSPDVTDNGDGTFLIDWTTV